MSKRKLGHEDYDEPTFDINKYEFKTLDDLILFINDYETKKLPSKLNRLYYPKKLKLLPNILEDLNDLNNLIGMGKLKIQIIDQILFFIQGVEENIMLHTVLEGPPGTGKTTVSQIMANIYSKLGIFKKVKFNVVKRADLISEYLGGTTIKTLETLDRCKNGVILIDEAYSLGSGSTGADGDMYAKECIDTINQYLTENVNKIICIIAGYKKELNDCFFSVNPGLKRRFPWTFTIENYNSLELSNIYFRKIKEREWDTDCNIDDVNKIINSNLKYFDGNGGDINSIIEKAMIINVRKNFGKNTIYNITLDDFKEGLQIFLQNKKSKDNSPPGQMYT